MLNFDEIYENIKSCRDYAQLIRKDEIIIHLYLSKNQNWTFYSEETRCPLNEPGYSSTIKINSTDDNVICAGSAMLLISGLQIHDNDELVGKLIQILDTAEKTISISV